MNSNDVIKRLAQEGWINVGGKGDKDPSFDQLRLFSTGGNSGNTEGEPA